jgi:acetaldehyde dehydrogenase (acetylating)
MKKNGAHWLSPEEIGIFEKVLFNPNGMMNPKAVGKTPQQLAKMAGMSVPKTARILVADLEGVGREYPLSGEKLTTVLGFIVEDGWHAGCERCIQLLKYGGDGHSLVIHARDEEVILAFGIEKPAFRIIVNSWGTLGAIGATTGVAPSMTLAPGGIGGSVVSDNITVTHLMNVKRLAYEIQPPPSEATMLAPDVEGAALPAGNVAQDTVEDIVRRVVAAYHSR